MYFRSKRYPAGVLSADKKTPPYSHPLINQNSSPLSGNSSSQLANVAPTSSSFYAPQGSNRFRLERPSSAPLPVEMSTRLLSPSPPRHSPNNSPTTSPGSTKRPSFHQRGEASSDTEDVSGLYGALGEPGSVEQRLKIVKRHRRNSLEAPGGNVNLPKDDTHIESYTVTRSSRLQKHEQHVIEAMVTQCLDALLFPSMVETEN